MSSDDPIVVFDRAALARLADPAAAVADARTWSNRVGAFDEDRQRVRSFLESVGADPDFVTGAAGLQSSLGLVGQRTPGERHVFVGVTAEAEAVATGVGWEYLDVETAAAEAGWAIE